jgi:hypothetical protein
MSLIDGTCSSCEEESEEEELESELSSKSRSSSSCSAMRLTSSEWHGFQYPPRFSLRVCKVRGTGTDSQTLTKPIPLRRVGRYFHLLEELVTSITLTLRCLFIQEFEVPYIWVHKCDYISYFNARMHVKLLSLGKLWHVFDLGHKYHSLLERKRVLEMYYTCLGVTNEYYEMEIWRKVDSVDIVSDATEWLGLKYKNFFFLMLVA